MIGDVLNAGGSQVFGQGRVRRRQVLAVLAGAVAVWGAGVPGVADAAGSSVALAGPAEVRAASGWGKGIELPGLAALNKGGLAQVLSVSCGSAGNCAAGGIYLSRHGEQGFVAVERNGRWGNAVEVPGLAALDKGENAQAVSVSCGAAGSCAVGGHYFAGSRELGFVAVERNGRWRTAVEMPGQAVLAKGGSAEVESVFCGAAGACTAGGSYNDRQGHSQGFVATERNGRWGAATEVPGLLALAAGGSAQVVSVSCGAAGNCAAGGNYFTTNPVHEQGFVATERNGRWGAATGVPGLEALNTGGDASVASVSCGAAGSCAAAGTYRTENLSNDGFAALEQNGHWGTATTLNGGLASSVSCPSAGYCAVAGRSVDSSGPDMFVAAERNGQWGTPAVLSDPASGAGGNISSLSCGSAGNCAVGGNYTGRFEIVYGFVAAERNGRWETAARMPRPGALGLANARTRVFSVSCAPHGPCTAGGYYDDTRGRLQGFVVTQTG